MKKKFVSTFFLFTGIVAIVCLRSPQGIFAQTDEQIDEFRSEITINKDGSILVTEFITYNFGSNQRHGIYREIPKTKISKIGEQYLMDFTFISVSDGNGSVYHYADESTSEFFKIRIGDPDSYLTGVHTYVIAYEVADALTNFTDQKELYWNVTGIEWDVPILAASAQIIIPAIRDLSTVQSSCYYGLPGSKDSSCPVDVDGQSIKIKSPDSLNTGEGLTIVIDFPSGDAVHDTSSTYFFF